MFVIIITAIIVIILLFKRIFKNADVCIHRIRCDRISKSTLLIEFAMEEIQIRCQIF